MNNIELFKHWFEKFKIGGADAHNIRNNTNKYNLKVVPTKSKDNLRFHLKFDHYENNNYM